MFTHVAWSRYMGMVCCMHVHARIACSCAACTCIRMRDVAWSCFSAMVCCMRAHGIHVCCVHLHMHVGCPMELLLSYGVLHAAHAVLVRRVLDFTHLHLLNWNTGSTAAGLAPRRCTRRRRTPPPPKRLRQSRRRASLRLPSRRRAPESPAR